jgi:Domain of unknown function DUF11
LADTLPVNLVLFGIGGEVTIGVDDGGCRGTTAISCTVTRLPGSGSESVLIQLTVRPTTPGLLINTATVSAATTDPNPANNSATQTTTVNPTVNPLPHCSDFVDNDGDLVSDFLRDPGCSSASDTDESPVNACAASYAPENCIAPPPPDLDCRDVPYLNFPVHHNVAVPDPHGFDGDKDGIGCEA